MNIGDPVLTATRLAVGYGRRAVLEDVSFEVRSGEFWFFLGPNGEGKTTLLRAILGLLRPRSGQLRLHPGVADRERVGFVPQQCDLNPTLPTTVREFVLLGSVGMRTTGAERGDRLAWALGKVGLETMPGRDYWSLSGGQRQRALVARALVRRPSLLLLDEPTRGLDLSAEDAVLRLLADLNRDERLTLLFVTHDIAIAAHYATHVALFHSRRVVAGAAEEVLNQRTLERVYGMHVDIPAHPFGPSRGRGAATEAPA